MIAPGIKVVDHRKGNSAAKAGNAYEMTDLVRKWEGEEITSEQMIGQILLHVQTLADRVQELERQANKAK